jgi:hypothetical protein
MSSVLEEGRPQEEQKRTLFNNSVPQLEHLAIKISRYSLQQDLGPQTRTSDLSSRRAEQRCNVRGPPLYYHPKR